MELTFDGDEKMRRKKTYKKIGIPAFAILFLLSIFTAGTNFKQVSPASDELTVHFIDVGQGDCTLITCGADAMLIDAGNNDQGVKVQNYLQNQNIETLRYVICTHPDADHIGGIDVILYKFDCETVIMTNEDRNTNTYRDVISAMKSKGYKNTLPRVGETYPLGEAQFTIIAPARLGDDSNNNSVAIILTHGENTFLFTGDAEEEAEGAMLESGISVDADVYKAGHHGSRTSSSGEFLNVVSPAYVVISCGEGNSYGHPHAETLNKLRARGVKVFRTDEQGSVVAVSNGSEITWNCSPSESWIAGEPAGSSKSNASASQPQKKDIVTYVCNTNSQVFHDPDCSGAKRISEKNRLSVTCTRDEVINMGYSPCSMCNP